MLYRRRLHTRLPEGCDRFLLVIAHPDDEVIFFRPTMSILQSEGKEVYILCLTEGDHEGLGIIRTEELYESAATFGIPRSRVEIKQYRDGRQEVWDLEAVKRDVSSFSREHDIQAIITFDDYGVTGHINHVSCYEAVRDLKGEQIGLSLMSRSVWIKGLGPLSVFVHDPSADYVLSSENVTKSWRHMKVHESQFVWYRKLLILISRYSYVNAYKTIT
jgi:N-acetylglucosaminylphosphatidylinositol deacetylase